MKKRIILTVALFCAAWFARFLLNVPGALVLGDMTIRQLDASNVSYLESMGVLGAFGTANWLISMGFIVGLLLIWFKPIRALVAGLALVLALLFVPQPASAYYADNDYAESFFILPNESAFVIKDVGDNIAGQAKFGSEDYYAANKIAAKRIDIITHTKLPNSGFWANKYVSSSRLIRVDRTPVSREWVKAAHRGTGKGIDESFPCQSSEGHDITVGIAIGASVTEDQAPKFLYKFGVNPPKGDPNDPNVVFTSVYYGKSLAQAMDGPVRSRVQALVCDNLSAHTLDEDNSKAAEIMTNIQKVVTAYMNDFGITLDFVGWADTFEFSNEVQGAIDRNYVSKKELEIATRLGPQVETLKGLSTATAIRTVSEKWNGATPTSVSLWWLPSSVSEWLGKAMAPGK